jgi:hypothetical protein
MQIMTFELSTPVKIAGLVGILLVVLAGAFVSYTTALHHSRSASGAPAQVSVHTVQKSHTTQMSHTAQKSHTGQKLRTGSVASIHRMARVVVATNLPAPLHSALRLSREVVAVVTAPGIPGDAAAVKEARLGARAAHVGFVVLNIQNQAVAAAVAKWAPNAIDPSVLVVKRPGNLAIEFDGYADRAMVTQAALDTLPR